MTPSQLVNRNLKLAKALALPYQIAMPHRTPADYEAKFAGLIKLCRDAKTSGLQEIVVAAPFVLGDSYDELVESLLRIAKADLALRIVPDTEVQRNN